MPARPLGHGSKGWLAEGFAMTDSSKNCATHKGTHFSSLVLALYCIRKDRRGHLSVPNHSQLQVPSQAHP